MILIVCLCVCDKHDKYLLVTPHRFSILLLTGEEYSVLAKCVINATGPYTDSIRKMADENVKNICQPASGVHIVLPGYYRSVRMYSVIYWNVGIWREIFEFGEKCAFNPQKTQIVDNVVTCFRENKFFFFFPAQV